MPFNPPNTFYVAGDPANNAAPTGGPGYIESHRSRALLIIALIIVISTEKPSPDNIIFPAN
jgi:hypothetical protein